MLDVDQKAGPDWEKIEHEVQCPLCEYNLKGLTQPRCPECGFEFSWGEVLDPTRQKHPYLFEHHRERNWDAFWRTLIGGLRPRRFWTTLHPAMPSMTGRLFVYWAIVLGTALLPWIVSSLSINPAWNVFNPTSLRARFAYEILPDLAFYALRQLFLLPLWRMLPVVVAWWTLLPVGTYVLLQIFQGTMRRARVKSQHVLRCIIYSSDILLWPSLLLLVLLVLNLPPGFNGRITELIAWVVLVSLVVGWAGFTWRVMVAYRRYLRFAHAEAAVISVQVILVLVWILVLFRFRF